MKSMAYRVIRPDGSWPAKYGYVPHRNILLTRGEAELLKVSIAAYNLGVELIIQESEIDWKTSPKRDGI